MKYLLFIFLLFSETIALGQCNKIVLDTIVLSHSGNDINESAFERYFIVSSKDIASINKCNNDDCKKQILVKYPLYQVKLHEKANNQPIMSCYELRVNNILYSLGEPNIEYFLSRDSLLLMDDLRWTERLANILIENNCGQEINVDKIYCYSIESLIGIIELNNKNKLSPSDQIKLSLSSYIRFSFGSGIKSNKFILSLARFQQKGYKFN